MKQSTFWQSPNTSVSELAKEEAEEETSDKEEGDDGKEEKQSEGKGRYTGFSETPQILGVLNANAAAADTYVPPHDQKTKSQAEQLEGNR